MKPQTNLYSLLVLGVFSLSLSSWGLGTSVGNFSHKFEEAFDFHIAYPEDWSFEETKIDEETEPVLIWTVSNLPVVKSPELESSLKIRFLSSQAVETVAELLAFAQAQHPDIEKWQVSEGDEIINVESTDIPTGPDSTRSFEYFLPEKQQVIAIETKKHEAHAGATLVDLIHSTISRASRPPEIKSIKLLNPERSPGPGEKLCYAVEVDDFKNSFTAESLSEFGVHKEDPLFTQKSAKWKPEESRFEVCVEVKSNSTTTSLRLKKLSIMNERGQDLECTTDLDNSHVLECGDSSRKISSPEPKLNIPHPDILGPEVQSMELNKEELKLTILLQDQSPIGGGVIKLKNGKSRLIFSDDIHGGAVEVDLRSISSKGWNSVEGLAFFDHNGERTVLKQANEVDEDGSSRYFYKSAQGEKTSRFEIINYLVHQGAK